LSRIKVGADADIVVFNPDKATVRERGAVFGRNGNFVDGVFPGAGVRTK
jgi:cytosine/adenosine deaminase-related metal-dependent hydrolase